MAAGSVIDLDRDADLVSLVEAYQLRLNALADQAAAMIRDAFLSLPEVRDHLLADFIKEAAMIVDAARLEGADLATGLVMELAGTMPKPVDLVFGAVDLDAPFLRTWHQLAEGQPFPDARLSGASEAERLGSNAAHDGANNRMAHTGLRVVGARRVLSPNACEWCQVVSVQRYRSVESASFGHGGAHNKKNCKCTAVAIYGKRDPGLTLNKRRYAELKASGGVKRVNEGIRAPKPSRSPQLPPGTDTTDPRVQRLLNLEF